MGRIFLYLLSGFLPKLILFENSIVRYASEKIHGIEELYSPANYLFAYYTVLAPMQQNGTERHRGALFCYAMADKPIRQKVISKELHSDSYCTAAKTN